MSFYPIDLPVYALGVLVVGLRSAVVPACAAAVFTILVMLAVVAARGRSRGLAGAGAAALTVAIMAGPAVRVAGVLLTTPDHTGTAMVPLVKAVIRLAGGWELDGNGHQFVQGRDLAGPLAIPHRPVAPDEISPGRRAGA